MVVVVEEEVVDDEFDVDNEDDVGGVEGIAV